MKIILGGRQSGKTNRMLKWLMDAPEGEHRVLVSHSLAESHRLMRYARIERNLPLESWQFVGWHEVTGDAWSGVLTGRGGKIVLGLDEASLILRSMLRRDVGAVSMGGQIELANPIPWESALYDENMVYE